MTTRQAGVSISDPQAYRGNLLKLLGDRNPLEVLAQTASTLADVVRKHSATVLHTRPFKGKWTPNEVIGHLADGEWVYGYRLRLILCEDTPTVVGTNQDLWVAGQRQNEREPSELVETFRTMRQFESLELMLRMTAGHDLSHLNQITQYIQAAEQRE